MAFNSTVADDFRNAMQTDTPLRAGVNAVRQAGGDTSFRQPAQALAPEDAAAYARMPQGVAPRSAPAGGLDPEQVLADSRAKYNQPSTGNLPIPGLDLARGPLPGKQVFNYYNPDAAPTGNNPWQDMARQLATFSMLRARGPEGPTGGIIGDGHEERNALFDKWDRENKQASLQRDLSGARTASQRQAILGAANQANQFDIAQMGNATQRTGQQLGLQGQLGVANINAGSHLAGIDRQVAGQQDVANINAGSHLAGIDRQGATQLGVAGLNASSHLAGIDKQMAGQQSIEQMKENSPLAQAQADYARSGVDLNAAHAAAFQQQAGKQDLSGLGHILTAIQGIPGFDPNKNPAHAQLLNHLLQPLAGNGGQKVNGSPHAEGTQLRGKDGHMYVVKNGQPVPLQ